VEVLEGRDPLAQALLHRGRHLGAHVRLDLLRRAGGAARGEGVEGELVGVLAEDAGRLPLGVAEDRPARRVPRNRWSLRGNPPKLDFKPVADQDDQRAAALLGSA